jgi:dihydrofolate reductase
MLSIIVAIAKNHAIGKDNQLLWHISEDLKRFKRITAGHKVIMGRNTLLSLPKWPLPKRTNIVITDNPEETFEGCEMVFSIEEAAGKCALAEECFVMGGASVYRQFMPLADKLYITRVNKDFEGDTFFPEINQKEWRLVEKSADFEMEDGSFSYRFETYLRNR